MFVRAFDENQMVNDMDTPGLEDTGYEIGANENQVKVLRFRREERP